MHRHGSRRPGGDQGPRCGLGKAYSDRGSHSFASEGFALMIKLTTTHVAFRGASRRMYPSLFALSLLLLMGDGTAAETMGEMTFGQRYALTPERPPTDVTGTTQVASSKDSSAVYVPGD